MDDAQQIVLEALQQAGIAVPDAAKTGNELLNSSVLVSICAQAVNSLLSSSRNDGSDRVLPTSLPAGMAERFRICTDLAGAVKLLGYRGDLSFHQFLYPSHKDTHNLLRFLLDKLSKSLRSTSTSASQGSRIRKSRTFGGGTENASTRMVVEALTKAHGDAHTGEGALKGHSRFQSCVLRTSVEKTVDGVSVVRPTLVTLQAKPRHSLIPSLLELNAKNAVRAVSKGLDAARPNGDGDVILTSHGEFLPQQLSAGVPNQLRLFDGNQETEVERDGSKTVEAVLQEQVKELQSQADRMETELQSVHCRISLLKEDYNSKEEEIRQVESEIAILREAVRFALDPSTDAVSDFQAQVTQGEQHMAALQAEWEAVRGPLQEKRTKLEQSRVATEGDLASKTKSLKETRLQVQKCTEKLRVREEQAWTLETELKEIASRAKRSSYVYRITELVKNSQKQETDIAKIITDTRVLQRDSNATNDRLRRTYALVDELVFRDAKKDPVCRQSYRQLTTIHETFANIVDKVLEMDKTGREIAELQAQLEELQISSLDMQSVQADVDAVAVETLALERRLARVQATSHSNILLSA